MPVIHRFGNLRGAKEKYRDKIWYCIWYPLTISDLLDDEEAGLCFDINVDDIDDAIKLLEHLKTSDVNDYTESITDGKSQI